MTMSGNGKEGEPIRSLRLYEEAMRLLGNGFSDQITQLIPVRGRSATAKQRADIYNATRFPGKTPLQKD